MPVDKKRNSICGSIQRQHYAVPVLPPEGCCVKRETNVRGVEVG